MLIGGGNVQFGPQLGQAIGKRVDDALPPRQFAALFFEPGVDPGENLANLRQLPARTRRCFRRQAGVDERVPPALAQLGVNGVRLFAA